MPEQISLGSDLYSVNCAQCHGDDGKVTTITGVKGLEGKQVIAINSNDVMYTLNDTALADIISYGRPDSGMTPFGKSYGGGLSPTEIGAIATFMRYSWDNRSVLPAGASLGLNLPALKDGEVPSYDVHIAPLIKHYCVACHSPGKDNDNYLQTNYDQVLNTGDNKPVIAAGDPESLMLKLITGHEGLDPKTGNKIRQMPPTKLLPQNYIDMFTRWVLAGMPKTAVQAAALSPTPTPTAAPVPTP